MKRFGVILCALLALTVITGCDFRVVRDWRQLVYHINTEPPTLNPILHTDAAASTVDSFLFDNLIERDNTTLEYKPMLAKRWEVSADHCQYTFYLRDDIYWHDGVKMTVDDIIYSFEQIMNSKVDAAALRVYYSDVVKVEKLDDYTVRFTYAFPYYRALTMLGGISIVPRHILDDGADFNKSSFGRNPVGNGPFKFKEWKTGRRIVLEKNENYWGRVPELSGISFQIITDMGVALQVLKKGQIDVASLSPIQWVKQTGSKNFNDRFNKYKYHVSGYSYVAWNQERPFFKDKRVRRALTMMLDRAKIAEKLHYDLVEVVTGDSYKFGPDYSQEIKPVEYDPEVAVKLLEEAGWVDLDGDGIREKDGVPFKFTFMITGSGPSRLANILRENLKKIGVDMEISNFEWTVFSKNLHDMAYDATMLGWSQPLEYDPYQVWHSSQIGKGSNYIGFKNKEADRIIVDARREFDSDKRHRMYKRFHEILYEEQPYIFLFMPVSLVAIQKRFTNVKIYKLGIDIREWGVGPPEMKLYQ